MRTTGPKQFEHYAPTEIKQTLNFWNISGDEIRPGDQFGYKIIMTVSEHSKFWWATRGLTHWTDDYTRDHGDKISKEAANELFPMMQHLGYFYRD